MTEAPLAGITIVDLSRVLSGPYCTMLAADMASATFHGTGHQDVADISDAYKLLSPLLGTGLASVLFAVALLCSGQNATLTGTLAGQIVMWRGMDSISR